MWPRSVEVVVIVRKTSEPQTLASVLGEWLGVRAKLLRRWQELCAVDGPPDTDNS